MTRIAARLFRADGDGFVFPESEVRKLIGQRPDFDGTPTEVLDAYVADGWVTIVVDAPPTAQLTATRLAGSLLSRAPSDAEPA